MADTRQAIRLSHADVLDRGHRLVEPTDTVVSVGGPSGVAAGARRRPV